ncbi:MAG TPA: hypothetical protein ENO30_01755 [Thermodesulfobium narugense]|nr:hypothetical protein [Thermodesulfobium narugense]
MKKATGMDEQKSNVIFVAEDLNQDALSAVIRGLKHSDLYKEGKRVLHILPDEGTASETADKLSAWFYLHTHVPLYKAVSMGFNDSALCNVVTYDDIAEVVNSKNKNDLMKFISSYDAVTLHKIDKLIKLNSAVPVLSNVIYCALSRDEGALCFTSSFEPHKSIRTVNYLLKLAFPNKDFNIVNDSNGNHLEVLSFLSYRMRDVKIPVNEIESLDRNDVRKLYDSIFHDSLVFCDNTFAEMVERAKSVIYRVSQSTIVRKRLVDQVIDDMKSMGIATEQISKNDIDLATSGIFTLSDYNNTPENIDFIKRCLFYQESPFSIVDTFITTLDAFYDSFTKEERDYIMSYRFSNIVFNSFKLYGSSIPKDELYNIIYNAIKNNRFLSIAEISSHTWNSSTELIGAVNNKEDMKSLLLNLEKDLLKNTDILRPNLFVSINTIKKVQFGDVEENIKRFSENIFKFYMDQVNMFGMDSEISEAVMSTAVSLTLARAYYSGEKNVDLLQIAGKYPLVTESRIMNFVQKYCAGKSMLNEDNIRFYLEYYNDKMSPMENLMLASSVTELSHNFVKLNINPLRVDSETINKFKDYLSSINLKYEIDVPDGIAKSTAGYDMLNLGLVH